MKWATPLCLLTCYLAFLTVHASVSESATPPMIAQPGDDFYNYSCNANTFNPSFSSFSSIWALLNAMIVLVTTVVYLMYLCFNKFLTAVTHV